MSNNKFIFNGLSNPGWEYIGLRRFKSTEDSLKPNFGIRISLEGDSPYHKFSFQVTVRLGGGEGGGVKN